MRVDRQDSGLPSSGRQAKGLPNKMPLTMLHTAITIVIAILLTGLSALLPQEVGIDEVLASGRQSGDARSSDLSRALNGEDVQSKNKGTDEEPPDEQEPSDDSPEESWKPVVDSTPEGGHVYQSLSLESYDADIPVYEGDVEGMQVVVFVPEGTKESTARDRVIYCHGGGFISPLGKSHLWYAALVAKTTGAVVYVPAYPLADEYSDYRDTYPPLMELYGRLASAPGHLTLMGDSAGGGLVVGMCQRAAKRDLERPEKLILISPWVDVTVTPWEELEYAGTCWAGSSQESVKKQGQVSPVYGEMSALHDVNVLILDGEDDTLSPSIQKFYRQLCGANVPCLISTVHAAGHDYAVAPCEPAVKSLRLICTFITGKTHPDDAFEWEDLAAEEPMRRDDIRISGTISEVGREDEAVDEPEPMFSAWRQ